MEFLKRNIAKILDAKHITIILAMLIFGFACSGNKNILTGDLYEITKYKSKSRESYITLSSYHENNKLERTPALYYINNQMYNLSDKLTDTTIIVKPGTYAIKARYISKQTTEVSNIQISEGDSIVVKLYLKDDPTPLR